MGVHRRNADRIAAPQMVDRSVQVQVDFSFDHIGDLLTGVFSGNIGGGNASRDLHQAEFDGATDVRCEELVQHFFPHAANDAVFTAAHNEPVGRNIVLKELEQGHMQCCRNVLEGIDGGVHRVAFDLAEHGGGKLGLCSQFPKAQAAPFPKFLYSAANVDLFHYALLRPVVWFGSVNISIIITQTDPA